MSKTVMLDWSSKKFEVTEAGYDQIKELIKQVQVCPGCHQLIDEQEHLLVGKKCLTCVLKAKPSLTFIGLQRIDREGDKHYAFVNSEGITLTSEENHSDDPAEDIAFSIEQAGFSIPTHYKPFKSQEEVSLGRSCWKVYGKLSQSVVVMHYKDTYSGRGTLEIDFLAYKSGQTVEFNKRTTAHKNMLENARMLAERTKRNGYYHLNGSRFADLEDFHLFTIIARLESAVYNEQLAFLMTEESDESPQEEVTQKPEVPTQTETLLSLETEENTGVAEPAQLEQTDQEAIPEPEKASKRGKLRIVKEQETLPKQEAIAEQ